MVLIHFVDMKSGEPRCGQPERANWLWTASTDEVTCTACWSVACERRALPRLDAGVAVSCRSV